MRAHITTSLYSGLAFPGFTEEMGEAHMKYEVFYTQSLNCYIPLYCFYFIVISTNGTLLISTGSLTSSPLSSFTTCWAFITLVDAIAVASAFKEKEKQHLKAGY